MCFCITVATISDVHMSQLCFCLHRYRVSIPVEYVLAQLAFQNNEEWFKFADPFGLKYADPEKTKLDCKTSMACLQELQ